jgi:hypothetical protein
MTGLADLLGRRVVVEVPVLPGLDRLRSSVRRILARWPDVKPIPEQDREQRLADLRDRERAGRWAGLFVSDLTATAGVLYLPEFRDRLDLARLRRFYPAEIAASTRGAFLGGMASVYLDTYEPGAAHSRELGRALDAARARLGERWQRPLRGVPTLFDPERAHADVAAQMVNMADPWQELKRIGLQPIGSGLMEAAHRAYVAALVPRLDERAVAERLVRWLKPEGRATARVAGAGAALDALLSPWVQRAPDETLKEYLTETIRDLYGHPRLGSAAVWSETSEPAKAVMLRWLTGASIKVFLDVVSRVESSHHWQPRRVFWLGLFEENRIQGAWAAFCPPAERVASRMRPTGTGSGDRWYGRAGPRPDTSLLILDLGHCIVVEGSHSYKVHVFRKDNPKRPDLYRPKYDCEEIRFLPGAIAIPHHSGWESRVLDAIWRCR